MLAVIGAVIAFAAILFGNSLEGGQLGALLDGPAFLIVVGGTVGAVILQTPAKNLLRACSISRWMLAPPNYVPKDIVNRVIGWCKVSRREGLLGLEDIAERMTVKSSQDDFQRKGLELVIDGLRPEQLRRLLEVESNSRLERDLNAAGVFSSMGGYAPTIGILGAVIGLIQVLGNLTNPDQLGQGIATAFVATIYGVGFANLLFLPIADRLKALAMHNATCDELIIEGLTAIAEGEHPRSVELRLHGLIDPA